MIKVVTDSTSDVPPEIAAELNISVVPVIVQIDGISYLDGITLTRQQFYDDLNSYHEIPKTAAPSPEAFAKVFRQAGAQGAEDIISIHVNRKFSGLCGVVEVAAQDVAADGLRVHVVDSETVTMGLGWLAVTAARMARAGARANQIVSAIEAMRQHVYIYAMMDTLQYLRRSGRANALIAGLGDMLQIKVLLGVHNSVVTQVDRIRTRSRGMARLVEVAHAHRSVQHLSVLHTSNGMVNDLTYLQSQLSDLMPAERQFVLQVTPVIGAHVGPMAVGVAVVADV
jgi:DegV family protein with EDD domain